MPLPFPTPPYRKELPVSRSSRSFALLLALALPTVSHAGPADEWTRYRGPGQGGPTLAGALPTSDLTLALAWRKPLGSGYSNLSVADGKVVTMFTSGAVDVLAAFDVATGEERWRYELGPKYAGHDSSDDGPLSTPIVAQGSVYALGPRGQLVALGLADGTLRWQTTLDASSSTPPFYGYTSTPVVTDELVILATGGKGHALTAWSRTTGERRWARGDDSVTYQTPLLAELGGRQQIVAVTDFYLQGLAPADGSVLWQLRHTPGEQGEASAHAIPVDGERFLVKYANDARLYKLGSQGPEQLWSAKVFTNTFALPAYHEGHFYGFTGNFLSAVRASDGEIVWRSRPPGGRGLTLLDGHLAILDPQGNLVLAQASPRGYEERARVPALGAGNFATPSFASGRFFVRNLSEIAAVAVQAGSAAAPASASAGAPQRLQGAFGRWVAEVEALPAAERQAAVQKRLASVVRTPVVEADGLTHFLWQGKAQDAGLLGDFLPREEEPGLDRVAGTDLFFRSVQLDPSAQYTYAFRVDFAEETVLDPKNPGFVDNGNDRLSDLRMPNWPAAPHLDAPPAGAARGSLDTLQVKSEKLGNTREVKVYRPAGYGQDKARRYPLLVVNHGDNLLRGSRWQSTLDNLLGSRVEPLIAVFVPRLDRAEYTGAKADAYLAFLVEELLPQLDKTFATDPKRRAILGPASAGVAALLAGVTHPQVFSQIAVQSFLETPPATDTLRQRLAAATAKPKLVYLVASRYDYPVNSGPNVVEMTRNLAQELRAAGIEVVEQIGTHSPNWIGWAGQDDDILIRLFPMPAGR
jgi:outer membrane protein assembly factor BamB